MKRLLAVAALALIWAASAHAQAPLVYLGTDSTDVTAAQLHAALPAFQTMVSRDLQAWWGVDATLTDDPALERQATMALYVTDAAGSFGALGEHGIQNNRPTAWVYGAICAASNESSWLVLGHELEEMLVDPWLARFTPGLRGRLYLTEVSDPVESGAFAYWIDGYPMSDFITPAWYGSQCGRRVDFTGKLGRPGAVGRHGYASFKVGGVWQQVFA